MCVCVGGGGSWGVGWGVWGGGKEGNITAGELFCREN